MRTIRNQLLKLVKNCQLREPETTVSTPEQNEHTFNDERWPAPMAEPAYHGLAGEFVNAISPHSESSPEALYFQLLIGCGNLFGRGPHFEVEATKHHTNLFGLIVGRTGDGRKGTGCDIVRRVLSHVDAQWVANRWLSGLTSGEGFVFHLRDARTQTSNGRNRKGGSTHAETVVDEGVKDKRGMFVETEFGGTLRVMSRDGNALSPVIREAWDRDRLATLSKQNPVVASNVHASIIGHVTPEELRDTLTNTDASNGFANRFLFVMSRRSKYLPRGGALSEKTITTLGLKLMDVMSFATQKRTLDRDAEANALWDAVYPSLADRPAGMLGKVTSRAEAQTMRIALVIALLDKSKVIRKVHLEAALAAWHYCEASAEYLFGSPTEGGTKGKVSRALQAAGSGGLSRKELYDRLGRNVKGAEIAEALEGMKRARLVRCERKKGKGRPEERWYWTEST